MECGSHAAALPQALTIALLTCACLDLTRLLNWCMLNVTVCRGVMKVTYLRGCKAPPEVGLYGRGGSVAGLGGPFDQL